MFCPAFNASSCRPLADQSNVEQLCSVWTSFLLAPWIVLNVVFGSEQWTCGFRGNRHQILPILFQSLEYRDAPVWTGSAAVAEIRVIGDDNWRSAALRLRSAVPCLCSIGFRFTFYSCAVTKYNVVGSCRGKLQSPLSHLAEELHFWVTGKREVDEEREVDWWEME